MSTEVLKRILIVTLTVFAFSFPSKAQTPSTNQNVTPTPQQQAAQRELDAAVVAYRDGDFAGAQQHSEKALAIDSSSKIAPLFIARSVHAQFKPGDYTEANISKARDAIEAYKGILQNDPLSEEAYRAIAYLYGATKQEELLRQWLYARALDYNFSAEKRAEAFIVLASKDWDCAFKITELPANHTTTVTESNKATIEYHMPTDATQFEQAKRCAERGMQLTETAIGLDPENESAWSYKANLLLELKKLAEMSGQADKPDEYRKQSNVAQQRAFELSQKNQAAREKRLKAEENKSPKTKP
jgi:hypothetical protein